MSQHVRKDLFELQIIDRFVSTTGIFTVFLGEHYDGTATCYDVGAIDARTNLCTRRHYPTCKGCTRKEASFVYEQFREELTAPDDTDPNDFSDEYRILGEGGIKFRL